MRAFVLVLLLACSFGCRTQDSGETKADDTAPPAAVDADGDGFDEGEDCDDEDPMVFPGADETCNGVDDDCDDEIDEDAIDAVAVYADTDGDGYGDPEASLASCELPDGYVEDDTDCDDSDAAVHPGADEYCNDVDDDCDGDVDEDDALDAQTWYFDGDEDGHGDPDLGVVSCGQGEGTVDIGDDCDDTDAATYPGADEWCDGVDRDCNGTVDDDYALDATTWYADADGDGYGDASASTTTCAAGSGHVTDDTDCDDSDALVYPGADEYCNGVDDDCDGDVDEDEDAVDTLDQYEDNDGDGYGGALAGSWCYQLSAYVLDSSDCDDADASVYPGAHEYCDSVDSDCDGVTDDGDEVDIATWYQDADLDGYGDAISTTTACDEPSGYTDDASDCDDADVDINPDASESCDGVDNDCDGDVDEDSAVAGDGADCAAESCAAILAARPSAADGSYYVDPAGSGTAIEVLCEMDIDGGGWTQARDVYLADLSTGTFEYLYSKSGAWYLSPSTSLIWDWSSYQVVEGTYWYSTGSEWAEGSFSCSHAESGHWGIGCSNGGGNQWKVLPWGSGQDGDSASCPICQDQPDVFAAGACASGVSIWIR